MFNLTSKKYIFFGISLLVILPGLLALLFWGLNPGIDFTGGTTVDLRFQNALSSDASNNVAQVFATEGKAKDVKIYLSQALHSGGAQTFWVQLNVPVDDAVQKEILARLQAPGDKLGTVKALPPLNQATLDGGKTHFSLLPFQITPPSNTSGNPAFTVTTQEVQGYITAKPLPNTSVVAAT